MLTRLRVSGFKNLVDVDVRFGPFTCVAGPNAVGKSNLFDAIRFLSALANGTLMEAALSVRSAKAATGDVRNLFHRVGSRTVDRMSLQADMITPKEATDDLGQIGKAKANFLRYTLELRYRDSRSPRPDGTGPLEIVREELVHIHSKEASKHIVFNRNIRQWQKTALHIEHRSGPFISTRGEGDDRIIYLHQDGGSRGRGISNPISQPRTVLSVANASESPTVLCARREMESWQMLQLEPSALREPDNINAPSHLDLTGLHLPKTLYHLANTSKSGENQSVGQRKIYTEIANRLSQLVDDVECIEVDYDRVRETLTLVAADREGTRHPARSLSDGTLRFLALAVLELDPDAHGVICLEEPENGIHPERIPAMLDLLQDIATDSDEAVDRDNPLRQVIVNTHSPAVVLEVPDDALLVAESKPEIMDGEQLRCATFSYLPDTWRAKGDPAQGTLSRGKLLTYLNPLSPKDAEMDGFYARVGRRIVNETTKSRPRVGDREDLQSMLPHVAE